MADLSYNIVGGVIVEVLKELLKTLHRELQHIRKCKKECISFCRQLDSLCQFVTEVEPTFQESVATSKFLEMWWNGVKTCLEESSQLVHSFRAGHKLSIVKKMMGRRKLRKHILAKMAELEKLNIIERCIAFRTAQGVGELKQLMAQGVHELKQSIGDILQKFNPQNSGGFDGGDDHGGEGEGEGEGGGYSEDEDEDDGESEDEGKGEPNGEEEKGEDGGNPTLAIHSQHSMLPLQSWDLFREHAFPFYHPHEIHPSLELVARDVASQCKGLPLVLKLIGRAMSNKRNILEWQDALNMLEEQEVITNDNHDVQLKQLLHITWKLFKYCVVSEKQACPPSVDPKRSASNKLKAIKIRCVFLRSKPCH